MTKGMTISVILLIATLLGTTVTPAYAWQLGWKTDDSDYARGINANIKADQTFLTNWIGLLQGFTDDQDYWINIGIGNDKTDSGCSNPPVLWEEILDPDGDRVAHYSLGCLVYGGTSQLSILYDSTQSAWGFFNAGGRLTTFDTGGTTIDDTGSVNMIERDGAPGTKSPTYSSTVFTNGLQYTPYTYYGNFPTFYNPSSTPYVHNNQAPAYFNTTKSASAPYQFTFTWGS